MDRKVLEVLEALTDKEREALREAAAVIYFNDRSDYINGLWGVVIALIGDTFDEDGVDIKDILYALDPEMGD